MTDKCQAPGLECEDCRLKCQLPLIEAEKAQRERVMNKQRDYEKDWQEFCLTDGLTEKEMKMRGYLRYWMFEYSLLKAELNRLQVALEATIAEKERCRNLAVDYALKSDEYKIRFERCENMKLAREFEDLLQTTSIPVAVKKVRSLLAIQDTVEELILFNEQVGLDIKDDGADNCARRTYGLLMRKLQALEKGASK